MKQMHINSSARPWFSSWFDTQHYHSLYKDRDDEEANRFIDNIVDELDPAPHASMLDVGCGAGRHSKRLASKGFRVTGFDLAASSIRQAQKYPDSNLRFYQHDMRVPFGRMKYDFVFNFFTSFGYFESFGENLKVVNNMSNALNPEGILLIDYLNVSYSERKLVAVEEKEIDGVWYHINRWSDDQFFYKRIAIAVPGGSPMIHIEKVAKFQLEHFASFFDATGLSIKKVYGNYGLDRYDKETSERMIIIAAKQPK